MTIWRLSATSEFLAVGYEILGYLHSIECCALLDLIADEPEGKTVGIGSVAADTAHIHRILPGGIERGIG